MAAFCIRSCLTADIQRSSSLSLVATTNRLVHKSTQNAQTTADNHANEKDSEEQFRVYEIAGLKKATREVRERKWSKAAPQPRYRRMRTDQDWTSIWPTAATFKYSAVPFPVRQGYVESSSENEGVVPSKYANLELMKAPNFLHLTPAHVKKHCQALKQFCTQWPDGLETDERCRQHFPFEVITSDYVFSGPSVRDAKARVASLKFHVSDLQLDYHARDKFIRLVGDRYDVQTDVVTLESDRCPLKSQNLDYLKFVLTALYFESWKTESWESLKQLSDMEKYFWDKNEARTSCVSLLKSIKAIDDASPSAEGKLAYLPSDVSDEDKLCSLSEVQQHKEAMEKLFNEKENLETLNNYRKSTEKLLNLKSDVS